MCVVLLRLISLFVVASGIFVASIAGAESATIRRVIWKFDDLRTGPKSNIRPNTIRVVDWANAHKTPISLGIICDGLDKASAQDVAWLKEQAVENGGQVEFWLHGWDHGKKTDASGKTISCEFQGSGLAAQTTSLQSAMRAMTTATGLTFHAFGAPFNAIDGDTPKALDQFPALKTWMYGPVTDVARTVLRPRISLEIKTGVVSYEAFMKAYTNPAIPYLLLQAHPPYWNDASFQDFTRIAAVLEKDGWQSITPSGYAALTAPAASTTPAAKP